MWILLTKVELFYDCSMDYLSGFRQDYVMSSFTSGLKSGAGKNADAKQPMKRGLNSADFLPTDLTETNTGGKKTKKYFFFLILWLFISRGPPSVLHSLTSQAAKHQNESSRRKEKPPA